MAAGKKMPKENGTGPRGIERMLRDDAEEQQASSLKRSPDLSGKTPEELTHELRVHQVDLEIQAEELRKSKDALAESRDKYLDLYEFAPLGYLSLNDKARITEVNLNGAALLGIERNKLIKAPFSKFMPEKDSDQWHRYFLNVLKQKEKQSCTLMIHRSDGSTFPARLESIRLTGSDGATTVRIAFSDISDIWQIEALQRKTATLSILNKIISTANLADNLPELLNIILEESLRLLDFDAGGIYLVDRSTRTANVVQSKNLPPKFLAEIQTVLIDKKPYDTLFIKKEPVITDNYAQIAPGRSGEFGFHSMVSIPLLSKGVAIGALNIASLRRQVISEDEKQMLTSIGWELGSTIERMAAEEEVKKARKNLETLFNSIDEMVFVLDMQGHILAVNETVEKRLSYTQRELTRTNVLLLHVPEQRDEALRNVQGMIAGTIDSCPVPILTKDGIRIEVETKVTHGWWNNQEVLIGVSRDVTDRKLAEEALRQLSDRLSLATQAGGVGIWEYDVVHNILTWDDQMFALYGITEEQFGGAYEAWQAGLHPEDKQQGDAEIKMALRGEKEFDTEFRVIWPDGSIRNIRALALVQRDAEGTPLRMIGTNWDITEHKRAEDAVLEANKKLNILNSITRHDVLNQISVLVMTLELIEESVQDAGILDFVKKAEGATERITRQIDFTREYQDIGVLKPQWQNVSDIIANETEQLTTCPYAISVNLDAVEIYADPLLPKVFYNLLENAIRHGEYVSTLRFSSRESVQGLTLVCEDNGAGVDAESKKHLFQQGFGKHTGFGLYLMREILGITDITIKETGEPGNGARFEMTVPEGMWRIAGK